MNTGIPRRAVIAAIAAAVMATALVTAACGGDGNGNGNNSPGTGATSKAQGTSPAGTGTGVGATAKAQGTTPAGTGTGAGATAKAQGTTSPGQGQGQGNGPLNVGPEGVSQFDDTTLRGQLDGIAKGELTPTERDGLVYMREEEKLAGDVYGALYAKWQTPIFTNIASAEQTHTSAVKLLLDRYGLTDPSAGKAAGEFTNPTLQSLYTSLVQQGSTSLIDALKVGAEIEELDISDLQARVSDKQDIALVYANLEKGSRNHLRAFASQLTSRSATYTPTHLSQSAFDAIIAGATEQGSAQ